MVNALYCSARHLGYKCSKQNSARLYSLALWPAGMVWSCLVVLNSSLQAGWLHLGLPPGSGAWAAQTGTMPDTCLGQCWWAQAGECQKHSASFFPELQGSGACPGPVGSPVEAWPRSHPWLWHLVLKQDSGRLELTARRSASFSLRVLMWMVLLLMLCYYVKVPGTSSEMLEICFLSLP